jgi:hypothetical protein
VNSRRGISKVEVAVITLVTSRFLGHLTVRSEPYRDHIRITVSPGVATLSQSSYCMPGCRHHIQLLIASLRVQVDGRRLHVRTLHSQSRSVKDTIKDDYAALIDPTNLRGTLDTIRDANRTGLIRKVGKVGDPIGRLSLPKIEGIAVEKPSKDALAIRRVEARLQRAERREKRGRQLRNPKNLDDALNRLQVHSDRQRSREGIPPNLSRNITRRQKHQIKRLTLLAEGGEASQKRQPNDMGSKKRSAGRAPQLLPGWRHEGPLHIHRRAPWLRSLVETDGARKKVSHERLLDEIQAFEDFITPSAAEESAAEQAFADFQRMLQPLRPELDAELIGSRASGLASALSDIDINMRVRGQDRFDTYGDREEALKLLRIVWKNVHNQVYRQTFSPLYYVAKTKVPIFKLFHTNTGLRMDVQCSNGAFNSLVYIKSYQREFPTVKRVFLVLRTALQLRGLENGNTGGLTSYPLLNMVVAACKSCELKYGQVDPARHLLEFLDMFSEIDFFSQGLSIEPFEVFSLVDRGDVLERFGLGPANQSVKNGQMMFPDPADPVNNLGRVTRRIRDVQETIIKWKKSLRNQMAVWDEDANGGVSSGQGPFEETSLLVSLLEADWRQFVMQRNIVSGAKSEYSDFSGWKPRDIKPYLSLNQVQLREQWLQVERAARRRLPGRPRL